MFKKLRFTSIWLVALLVLLPGLAVGQDFIRSYPSAGISALSYNGTTITSTSVFLGPAGAVTAPTYSFSASTATGMYMASNDLRINVSGAGAGIYLVGNGTAGWRQTGVSSQMAWYPGFADYSDIGATASTVREFFLARSIQGSKSKALTESSATSFTQVAVPQTAGANHAAGKVIYEVYATDGTDSQSLIGSVYFSAVNKAGTETCSIGLVGTEILAVSAVSTLTCTHTCVTGLVDAIQIASNCVSSLVQTTFTIQSRLDMPQPNTVTPQ